jgi:hypothetical protein
MYNLFRAGGFPMFFVVGFGLAALITAFSYAMRPAAEREKFVRWMALATVASVICGTAADLAAVAHYVASASLEGSRMGAIVIEGIGESMSPAIFGFSILSLTAAMIAVGKRRVIAV